MTYEPDNRHDTPANTTASLAMDHDHPIGATLDELPNEDGILAECEAVALKRVLAWKQFPAPYIIMEEAGLKQRAPCRNSNARPPYPTLASNCIF